MWNFVDITPPIIVLSISALTFDGVFNTYDIREDNRELIAVMLSIASLCLWFRLLYFLRIFEETGFLIRAILAVCVDMRYFMLILMITMIAFGDAFKVMSIANTFSDQSPVDGNTPNDFIDGGIFNAWWYAYLIGLGEFNIDDLGAVAPKYCLGLFFVNTIFTTIIMLNLFIAIISESFDDINQQGSQASYREKAGLIAENQFLLSIDTKLNWCKMGKCLLYA